jgi:hypothetical protein
MFMTLTDLIPDRCTTRQTTAFFIASTRIAMGSSITLAELLVLGQDDDGGQPILGSSGERILDPFLLPTKRNPSAVAWLTSIEDVDDRRRKLLQLTPKGHAVVEALVSIFRGDEELEPVVRG